MINRLLGMIYILMKQGTVTAAELAERFEVSARTIYRDMDTLSAAGIPIYAKKGKNGGICLTEQFVLDKMLITQEEQQKILSGLISLRETRAEGEEHILQKLGAFFKTDPIDWLAIDLSDWSGSREQLYEDIRTAILGRRLIRFDYYGKQGEMSRRTVEPVKLLFKEYTWYLKAFCRERNAWRIFKLFRMKRFETLDVTFVPRQEPCSAYCDRHLDRQKRGLQDLRPVWRGGDRSPAGRKLYGAHACRGGRLGVRCDPGVWTVGQGACAGAGPAGGPAAYPGYGQAV